MAVKGFLAIVDDIENGDLPFAAQVNNGSCAQETEAFSKTERCPAE